jgi:sugar transferase EpsL
MYSFSKPLLDKILVALGLILVSPILIIVAVLVRVNLGSPILFSQERPGHQGKLFKMYKFRTMTDQRNEQGQLLPDSTRLTPFGKLLRSTSLDELPELFNVLKGDMSLIGPRPLLTRYLDLYTPEQARRHQAKPGITGWAQINGRNAISWEEKFKLDTWYIDNISFWLDCKILFLTFSKVIKRSDISQTNNATMEEFMGTTKQH